MKEPDLMDLIELGLNANPNLPENAAFLAALPDRLEAILADTNWVNGIDDVRAGLDALITDAKRVAGKE